MGRAFYKESNNIVERLQECHRLQALTVLRGGTSEQVRPPRPRSGLDFQIHKSRDYLVTILEALLLTIGLAWQKSILASLQRYVPHSDVAHIFTLFRFFQTPK